MMKSDAKSPVLYDYNGLNQAVHPPSLPSLCTQELLSVGPTTSMRALTPATLVINHPFPLYLQPRGPPPPRLRPSPLPPLPERLRSRVPHGVPLLAPTVAAFIATSKVGLICVVAAYLIRTEKLPPTTPTVLSRVAFHVFIPCTLATNIATSLALTASSPTNATRELLQLAAIPLFALAQIAVGLTLGRSAAKWVDKLPPGRAWGADVLDPARSDVSARLVAASTAAAIGVPAAGSIHSYDRYTPIHPTHSLLPSRPPDSGPDPAITSTTTTTQK